MSEAGFGNGVSVNCCWSTTSGAACPWAGTIGRAHARIARTGAKAKDNRVFIFLFPLSSIRNFHSALSATQQYTPNAPSCVCSASSCTRSNAKAPHTRLGRVQAQRASFAPFQSALSGTSPPTPLGCWRGGVIITFNTLWILVRRPIRRFASQPSKWECGLQLVHVGQELGVVAHLLQSADQQLHGFHR